MPHGIDLGLTGKTAIVCGSSAGLGKACATALARAGVLVTVNGRDEAKLKIAREHGAHRTFNPKDPEIAAKIAADGGADSAIDFVGAPASYKFAFQTVRRGGKVVMVGLFGGDSPLSLASMPMRMLTIEGSYVGNLEELHELMALVRNGKVQPMPYSTRPLEAANDVLEELKAGKIVGRVVLRP